MANTVIKKIQDSSGTTYDIIDTDTKDTAGVSTTTRPLYLIGTYYNEASVNVLPEKIATTYSCGDLIVVRPDTGKLSTKIIDTEQLNTMEFNAPEIYSNKITVGSIILDRSTESITLSGDITANAFYQSSDERLKTFTEDYDINLDDIKNIKTGRFYWNSDEKQVINGGVTAQSVEKYFPELVREDENGTKIVNYDGLAGVAIAAIKKLTERIEELENIVYNK